MKRFYLLLCLAAALLPAKGQVALPGSWKFHTGDDPAWSQPGFDDGAWKSLHIGQGWDSQGYQDYDGFAWYRTHLRIPSSLKTQAYLKGELKLQLGKIDDGDQVYLNGKLVGQNAGRMGTIEQGPWNQERVYRLPTDDPAIHWDGDNVIAVRVYDHSGNGGMYEGPYGVAIADITDLVHIDAGGSFAFSARDRVHKTITLRTASGAYAFSGRLRAEVVDPLNGRVLSVKDTVVRFSEGHPFHYNFRSSLPPGRPCLARYTYTESRSGKTVQLEEGIPYILTPAPSPRPRINGARITGVRPGHPLLFRIPATGRRPLRFTVADLPAGLHLDAAQGIISGRLDRRGTYRVHIRATNALGSDTSHLDIVVGDLVGLTPAMGWNSWNAWGLSVNDQKVRRAADVMVRQGLVNHGWTYINIDDGWEQETRAADGSIRTNDKFPDMKALSDYVHSLGLKLGIYSSPGTRTCGGFLGSYQHELQDARSYAAWGIDYLKYDWCSYGQLYPHPNAEELRKPYQLMRACLDSVDRDIYFSLCQYGMGDVWTWGASVGGNSWRTTGDITDTWSSMSGIGFAQGKASPYSAPGHWNDPDMLVVGKVGWGPSLHQTRLSPDEQYTHISLWCLLSAPLLIGCDMSQLDDFTLSLLTNDEVLAVDQDPLGKGAVPVSGATDSIQVWHKELADGSQAVGIFNLGEQPAAATLSLASLGLQGRQQLRDLWRQRDLGEYSDSYRGSVPAHGVLLLKISPAR